MNETGSEFSPRYSTPKRPPKAGDLICYRYVWANRNFARTPNHADKVRPVLVLHREPLGAGCYQLMLLAISTKKQREPDKGLAVPHLERQRAGLKEKSWVVATGINRVVWPSRLFEPFAPPTSTPTSTSTGPPSHQGAYARFSAGFFAHIAQTVSQNIADAEAEKQRKLKRLLR